MASSGKRKASDEVVDLISDDENDASPRCAPSTPAPKCSRKDKVESRYRRILNPIKLTLMNTCGATKRKIPDDTTRLQVIKEGLLIIGNHICSQVEEPSLATSEDQLWEYVAQFHWPQSKDQNKRLPAGVLKNMYHKLRAKDMAATASNAKKASSDQATTNPPALLDSRPKKSTISTNQLPITPKTPAQRRIESAESPFSPSREPYVHTQNTPRAITALPTPNSSQEAPIPPNISAHDPATSSPPTPPPTAPNPRPLLSLPELAPRYLSQTSTASAIEYTNPSLFSLNPPLWRKWTPHMYATFATHLREIFDPVPLARKFGRPVEEVVHVFSAVVVGPLYDAKEAKRRGEGGMREVRAVFKEGGTVVRVWGKEEKEVRGELDGVEEGGVRVVGEDGGLRTLEPGELGSEDRVYLKETLTTEHWRKVFSGVE